jgi:hypothetical protein
VHPQPTAQTQTRTVDPREQEGGLATIALLLSAATMLATTKGGARAGLAAEVGPHSSGARSQIAKTNGGCLIQTRKGRGAQQTALPHATMHPCHHLGGIANLRSPA